MKKVLRHPLVVIAAFGIIFMLGVLVGRHTTYTVTQFIENDGSVTQQGDESSTSDDDIISSPLKGKININTADLGMLCQLPGIGQALAKRIIDYREANGPFKSVEELTNVEGFGETRLKNLKKYITTGYMFE